MADLKLNKINPSQHLLCESKEDAIALTAQLQKKMYDLLYMMFAHNKYSLLIILQGIDTSGKDGVIRHLFAGANPQGLRVFSFKKPTPEEARHDFLWRCHQHVPESGLATIFNRSYYEEVTTVKIHPELLQPQNLPDEIIKNPDFFKKRYERINDFEKLLFQKGTQVLKFFLHISKEEQKIRIKERLRNRSKNWKFSLADVKERRYWDKYMHCFEEMITHTHTKHAPWTVVAADNKWYRDFLVSKTIVGKLEELQMSFPRTKFKKMKIV